MWKQFSVSQKELVLSEIEDAFTEFQTFVSSNISLDNHPTVNGDIMQTTTEFRIFDLAMTISKTKNHCLMAITLEIPDQSQKKLRIIFILFVVRRVI